MKIEKVAIIGMGALGTMYGNYIVSKIGKENLRFIADKNRIERYRRDGVYCNGEKCDFEYVDTCDSTFKPDLLIFAVKFTALESAIKDAENFVSDNTIILSVLNGITSEEIIGEHFGMEKMLYCTVQGMDAVKTLNKLTYYHMGNITFGEKDNTISEKVKIVKQFFDEIGLDSEVPSDMMARMWSKLMLNTGVNQSAAVFKGNYGTMVKEGIARDVMIGAMKEVLECAHAEGVNLSEKDIQKWLDVLKTLNPEGKPSLRQDTEAHRKTEVELFSGTIISLGKKLNIQTPYNDFLYKGIKEIEESY